MTYKAAFWRRSLPWPCSPPPARARARRSTGRRFGSITFDGVWTGAEAANFGAVIKAFNKSYPDVKVNYKPVGDNLPHGRLDGGRRR